MPESFALIDDKHVPLARVVWVSNLPHFCGNEDCDVEGRYEIRIEGDDSLFASREERDETMNRLGDWLEPR